MITFGETKSQIDHTQTHELAYSVERFLKERIKEEGLPLVLLQFRDSMAGNIRSLRETYNDESVYRTSLEKFKYAKYIVRKEDFKLLEDMAKLEQLGHFHLAWLESKSKFHEGLATINDFTLPEIPWIVPTTGYSMEKTIFQLFRSEKFKNIIWHRGLNSKVQFTGEAVIDYWKSNRSMHPLAQEFEIHRVAELAKGNMRITYGPNEKFNEAINRIIDEEL